MSIFVAIVMYSMNSFLRTSLALVAAAFISTVSVYAQLVVNTNSPFKQYVANLAASGVNITNINITGCDTAAVPAGNPAPPPVSQLGGFNATGVSNFWGLTTGLLLSSGDADKAAYTNTKTPSTVITTGAANSLLNNIITPSVSDDACAVTFTMNATCDTVYFKYVFASSEYSPTYVLNFDDACGIFISGPGYASNTNIALDPADNSRVSVFGLNGGNPPAVPGSFYFYQNAMNPLVIGAEGYTRGLVAKAPVQIGQNYTVTMAVGDANDNSFDTFMFVEKGSCTAPEPFKHPDLIVRTPEGMVEGCRNGRMVIKRGSEDDTLVFNVVYTGIPTILNDFNSNVPGPTVTMLPNEDSIVIDLTVLSDVLVEPTEVLGVIISDATSQNMFDPDTASIKIMDAIRVFAGPDTTVCTGNPVQLGGGTSNPNYTYKWSTSLNPSGLSATNILKPTVTLAPVQTVVASYNVIATDTSGCTASDNVVLKVVVPPTFTFAIDDTLCQDELSFAVYAGPSDPSYQYTWNFGAFSTSPVVTTPITTASWSAPGLYPVSLQVSVDGCASSFTRPVVVNPTPQVSITNSGNACPNVQVQLSYGLAPASGLTYIWNFDGGTASGNNIPNPVVTWSTPGDKYVTLQVVANGCSSAVAIDTVTIYPIPVADFTLPQTICLGDTALITYTGDVLPNMMYAWNLGGAVTVPGGQTTNQPGPYAVYWTTPGVKQVLVQTQSYCSSVPKVKQITVLSLPNPGLNPVSNQCLAGNSYTFTPTSVAGMDSYSWWFGTDALPFSSTVQNPPAVTYTQPGIKHVIFSATDNGCRSVPDTLTFEVYPTPEASFVVNGGLGTGVVCPGTGITVSYNGTSVDPNQVYNWTFQDGVPNYTTDATPPTVTFTSGGSKYISLVVNYMGCTDTLEQMVTVNPLLVVDAGPMVDFCEGDGGVATMASISGGTPGYSYIWSSNIPVANWGISNIHALNPVMNPTVQPTAPSGSAEVVYTFKAVDANGCISNIDSMTVMVKAKPKVNAGPDDAICAGGPGVNLSGTPAPDNIAPNLTFSWTPTTPSAGIQNPNTPAPYVRPSVTTQYTLIGTSSNGCSSQATTLDPLSTVTVLVRPTPIVNAGPDRELCSGESITLNTSVSGAGPTYFYVWTSSPANAVVSPASGVTTGSLQPTFTAVKGQTGTTVLMLSATSNGCMGSDSVRVTVNALPTPAITGDKNVCYGDTITNLYVTTDPLAGICSFEWINPGAAQIVSDVTSATPKVYPMQNATIQVRATSAQGCSAETSHSIVVEPTALVGILQPDATICEGTELSLKASVKWVPSLPPGGKVYYTWTPAASIEGPSNVQTVKVRPTTTTRYQVQTQTSGFGCVEKASVNITVVPKLDVLLPADTTICSDETKVIKASNGRGNAKYTWYTDPGVPLSLSSTTIAAPIASPKVTTTYYLATEEGICRDADTITITVNKSPVADFFASESAMCVGKELYLQENASDAIALAWHFGDGSPVSNLPQHTHVYAQPGNYTIDFIAIGQAGCRDTMSKQILVHTPSVADFTSIPAYGSEQIPADGGLVTFFNGSQNNGHLIQEYSWEFGDGSASGAEAPTHTYTQPGTYMVKLTTIDDKGCVSVVEHGPYQVVEPGLFVANVLTPNGDGKNDVFRVAFEGQTAVSFQIIDRWGRVIFEGASVNDVWNGQMPDGTPAAAGVYFYQVTVGSKILKGDLNLIR